MGRVGGMLRIFFIQSNKGCITTTWSNTKGFLHFVHIHLQTLHHLHSSFFLHNHLWFCINTMSLNMQGGLDRIWPNRLGTRILFETDQEKIYYYNPLNDQVPISTPCCTWSILISFFKYNNWFIWTISLVEVVLVRTDNTMSFDWMIWNVLQVQMVLDHTSSLEEVYWDGLDPHIFVLKESSSKHIYVYSFNHAGLQNISSMGPCDLAYKVCYNVLWSWAMCCLLWNNNMLFYSC